MRLRNLPLNIALMCMVAMCSGCAFMQQRTSHDAVEQARRLVDQATLALRAGDLDAAQAGFEVALQNTALVSAIDGLGCVALLRGEYEPAARLFKRAIDQDPRYAAAYFNLAMVLDIQGAAAEAETLYRRGLALKPNDARGRANYAALLADEARSQKQLKNEARRELMRAQALGKTRLVARNIEHLEEAL